jgi:hypothetical protein
MEIVYDFDSPQMVADTGVQLPCCGGVQHATALEGIARALEDGADLNWASDRLRDIGEVWPLNVTLDLASSSKSSLDKIRTVLERDPSSNALLNEVRIMEHRAGIDVVRAEAGPNPTPQQVEQLGKMAMQHVALAHQYDGGDGRLATMSSFANQLIQQAEAVNPLFALSMNGSAIRQSVPHTELVSKHPEGSHISEKPAEVKGAPPQLQAASESLREATQPPQKDQLYKESSRAEAQPGRASDTDSTAASKQPASSQDLVSPSRTVSQSASPSSVAYSAAASAAPTSFRTVTPQASSQQPSSQQPSRTQPSSTSIPSNTASLSQGRPNIVTSSATSSAGYVYSRTTQRVALIANAQNASQAVNARPVTRSVTLERQGVRASGAKAHDPRISPHGLKTQNSQAPRGNRGGGPSTPRELGAIRRSESQAAPTQPRVRGVAQATQALRELLRKVSGARDSTQGRRSAKREAAPRQGQDKGSLSLRAGRRVDFRGVTIGNIPIRQLTVMLMHLRALSPQELRSLRLERHAQPTDIQVALAIRDRAQRLLERLKNMPLKDSKRVQGISFDPRELKRTKGHVTLSPRELLARREVRLVMKDLISRLQSFLDPRSMLYRRITTELTLADVERLVSILGGNRAVKGLRKKHKAGEITQVLESDISNSFLSQLASSVGSSATGGDSGSSDDGTPAPEGEVAEASIQTSAEESTLVADGVVPTATLSTVIMKEEPAGGLAE